jgi:adenosylcobinamide-phosphate synthase
MVGYKNAEYKNIGWFTAKIDTLVNYVPTRLTAILMVASSGLLGYNWRESLRILKRDKNKTTSLNAGWTISAMAGALNVQLEKKGSYKLGDDYPLEPNHIFKALRMMEVSSVLFGLLVVLPFLTVVFIALGFLY